MFEKMKLIHCAGMLPHIEIVERPPKVTVVLGWRIAMTESLHRNSQVVRMLPWEARPSLSLWGYWFPKRKNRKWEIVNSRILNKELALRAGDRYLWSNPKRHIPAKDRRIRTILQRYKIDATVWHPARLTYLSSLLRLHYSTFIPKNTCNAF